MPQDNNKRIAKNTLMLYIRMLFGMIVAFYTSRVILSVLGVVDFGINNVVSGVAVMFSFLNSSLSGATSRFLTFELGKNNINKLKQTFSAAFTIHVILALIIFVLCETIGLWLLEYKLVIPEERMFAARILYQLSIVSTLLNITQVPFGASIIAHEKMNIYAYLGIIDILLKLVIVYLIQISPFDKLVSYGIMFFFVSVLMLFVYRMYSIRHFEECSMKMSLNKSLTIPMLKFSGWDLYGNLSVMLRGQGVNVLQNMFWGPAINAATGVANQILNAILGFSNNFLTAVRPQIVKMYAQGNISEMQKLVERSSKFSFFLLFFISFPCFIEIPFVLDVWLEEVPEFTVEFARWSLVFNWIVTMFLPLMYVIHATGRVKRISIINGSLYILVIPITYVAYNLNAVSPTFPFIVNALFVIIGSGISNLYTVHLYIPSFKAKHYIYSSVLRGVIAGLSGAILPLLVHIYYGQNWIGFFMTCIASVINMALAIYFIGLDLDERKKIVNIIKNKINIKK